MADNKFDINTLKDNVGSLMGSLKSMINPSAGVPNVDPDDALGMKIAQLTTLVKQLMDVQQEHVKGLAKVNELLNAAFQDIQTLRGDVKNKKVTPPAASAPAEDEKK